MGQIRGSNKPCYKLTHVDLKTANYDANPNESIHGDVSGGEFYVKLPPNPAADTVVQVQNFTQAATSNVLEIQTSAGDYIAVNPGPTSVYLTLFLEVITFHFDKDNRTWDIENTAPPSAFATGNPGISARTPITADDLTFDLTARTMTLSPSLGYFYINTDGGGKSRQYRKEGAIVFPAWDNTTGIKWFSFDQSGTAVTSNDPWTNFSTIAPVQRFFWNATETGDARIQSMGFEGHLNDIPADTHEWMHLHGTIWGYGLDLFSNQIDIGSPAADGSNTVVSISSGSIIDDNLTHTVTNGTGAALWEQDLGDIVPATLTALNSGQFAVMHYSGDSGIVETLPATRFPFPWGNNTANSPDYIQADGTINEVTNNYFHVTFLWAVGDQRNGKFVHVTTATTDFASLVTAQAYTWDTLKSEITLLGDNEIRPLYRLIFERKASYNVGAKYSALREVADLRKAVVTTSTAASGSVAASSVTFAPVGDISSTNVQSALQELDTEKSKVYSLTVATGDWVLSGSDYYIDCPHGFTVGYMVMEVLIDRLASGSPAVGLPDAIEDDTPIAGTRRVWVGTFKPLGDSTITIIGVV